MRRFFAVLSGIGALALTTPVAAQDTPPTEPEIPVWEISFGPDGLSGPGADVLREEIARSQFVALGEDHGFADTPQLGRGLAAEMKKHGRTYHAVEIGPWSNKAVQQALRTDGVTGVATLVAGKPIAIPFVSSREDALLANDFAEPEGTVDLWGIDQEFIGAPTILLEELKAMAPNAVAREAADSLLQKDLAAVAAADQGNLLMLSAPPATFTELRAKFTGSPEAQAIIDSLAESAVIYQHNNARRYFANNADRITLMHRLFLQQYHEAEEPAPRVLLKMGAYHLGRGTTPTKMFDIGSLLPGLAAANRMQSLHIAFSGLSGEQLTMRPSPEGYTQVKAVDDKIITPILEAVQIDSARIGDTGHYLIPLEPIRRKLESKGINELSTFGKFVVLGFDYIVTTKAAKAATPMGE
ncbi:hypothetical protein GCM10009096_04180 [Parasphingorhabdus litoris]|uniref:Erythromycin esterase family protein n=1 Tax=Parasphingorhabdus litoris TaxID=394733 RepID=A0ABP3JXP7_9SPHN|nr:hypothetical protein [Parasphingorhabdus litoris]